MKVEKTHERQNRFSGESIWLTKEEAKIHDSISIMNILRLWKIKKLGLMAILNFGTK